MDDLHLQADLVFGPCNDPSCPGSHHGSSPQRLELVWPSPTQERPIEDGDE